MNPAWQNLQPRIHPRRTSTTARSWTIWVNGTTKLSGAYTLSKSFIMRFLTFAGAPFFAVIDFTVPSSL